MGNAQKGETSEVTIKVKDDSDNGSYKLMVYALDEEIFKEAYGKLSDEQLEITKFSDTEIEGKITAQNDGVMFLSIPYEKGWSIYVDGEKAETVKVVSSMLGVNLTAGEHDIRIEYVPEGFVPGAAATGVSAVLCVGIAVFDFKRRKKRKSDNPESDDEIIETAEEVTTEAESDEVTETITENEPDEVVKTEEEAPAETETSEADIIETSEGTKSEIETDEVDTEEENEKS